MTHEVELSKRRGSYEQQEAAWRRLLRSVAAHAPAILQRIEEQARPPHTRPPGEEGAEKKVMESSPLLARLGGCEAGEEGQGR